MKTFLFIGSNSDVAKEALKILESNGNKVICISRNHIDEVENNLIGNPVLNDLPEIDIEIDGLVYFPGSITLKPFRSLKQVDFQKELEINVLGAIQVIQHFLPNLLASSSASVVLFSTVAVQVGMPYHASIAVSKGAIEGLTRSLAAEYASKIRFNCIAPSLTDTPLAGRLLSSPEKKVANGERHPMKRVGEASDLAEMAAFLMSDKSSWITGQIMHVDGGMSNLKTN
jgi:NAD(P)-dependent dehydrogenase (short-subunit alcohol dehydrogenase family)